MNSDMESASVSAPPAAPPERELGFTVAVALVVGSMIGSGVFLLPASLAPYGGLSMVGWVVSAGGAMLLALVFAYLARLHPAAGGPYAYTRRAFGDLPGFLVAWGYWIACWSANAALAVAFVGYLDPFLPGLVRNPTTAALAAVSTIWVLTAVNIRGVRTAGRVQVITTAIKVLPLLLIGFAGLAAFQPTHFALPTGPNAPSGLTGVLAVVTLTLWAFLGVETATVAAGRIRNPERTIPRATIIGTLAVTVIYIASTAGVMSVIEPDALSQTTAPFADAARVLFGDTAARLIAAGAAISCFGALNAWILMAGEMPRAAAADGMFPAPFARQSKRGTSAVGLLIAGVLATILVGANYSQGLVALFTFVILLSTLSTLVPYTFCSLAVLLSRDSAPDAPSRASAAVRVIAGLAFLYSLVAIVGAGVDDPGVIYWGVALLGAGLPVYAWLRYSAHAS